MECPRCHSETADSALACAQCRTPLPSAFDTDRIRTQLKKWQERLIDLTKGNPLLGINRSRVSKLRVREPNAHALFRDFVIDATTLEMPLAVRLPKGDSTEEPAEDEWRIERGDVVFDAKPPDLKRRLRRIYDNARTTVEERGVTTLHLSFGTLKWEDPALGESVSPLWLVPCELQSFGPSAPMKLALADEEIQLNPALELYLRERHRVTLPPIPEEPTAESLTTIFDEVGAAVRDHGWKVEDDVWLSTYTFDSLVIYQDLKAMEEVAIRNWIVAALARATPLPEGSEALGEDSLDAAACPDPVPIPVLPTDSSQLRALTVARSRRHLVVHGPPGTGKSQTISSVIADALGQGKTVLFVSAKMAALDVVHARLARLGLDRFCLEAHSTKAGKAKIIEALKRTLASSERGGGDERFDETLEDLVRVRDGLTAYVREVNERRQPLGLSVYQAIGKVERLGTESDLRAPLPWDDLLRVTRAQLKAALDALADLGAQAAAFDGRAASPWRGFAVEPQRPVRRDAIETDLLTIRDRLRGLLEHLGPLATFVEWSTESLTWASVKTLAPALAKLGAADGLPANWATREIDELLVTADLLVAAADYADEDASARAQHDRVMTLPIGEARRLLAPAETQFARWTRVLHPAYWRWMRAVHPHLREDAACNFLTLRGHYTVVQRLAELEGWFQGARDRLAAEVGGDRIQEAEHLRAAAGRLQIAAELRQAVQSAGLVPPAGSPALTDEIRQASAQVSSVVQDERLEGAITRLDSAWPGGFPGGLATETAALSAVLARCEEVLAAMPRLHEWIALQHTLGKCRELGLGPFLDVLAAAGARFARGAFERRFYTAWANAALESSPPLATFVSGRRDEQIQRFQGLDAKIRESKLAQTQAVASDPARRVATAQGGIGTASQVGILRRELEKRRRIRPLRKLFADIPNVLQGLKPCMLMSPLSVSTFLKPGAITFDVVVFDEASQLPTPEAIPAILRARQVIVAGDANQLPPTSFFEASMIFDAQEGDDEFQPLESVLDDCVAIFPVFDHAHLRWHYRSKDERLITFSNHYFYRDRPLITFPSVSRSSENRGVRLVYLADGVWDRGGSRTNRGEARRVAELVVQQLERHPERSLGVVAMNTSQREAVEEALDEVLLRRPDLAPLLRPERAEPFFIKALENVQGDERDTLIISVGYGKSPTGALTFNFGPLNQEGGWRRLNVLVTRARWHTILVTSMRSQELAGVNPNNRGAVALRNFIAYAERGGALPAEPVRVTGGETNDFEDAVAEVLRERGYMVDQQVGASEYRIDLAIRDPRDPQRYLLGVECDGATYHSAKTARDRDLLRQQVLREQGWRLYRLWSTNWFRDREAALAGALRAIEQAQQEPLEESVPAAAPPSSAGEGAPDKQFDSAGSREKDRATPSATASAQYPPGEPYAKYRGPGERRLLLHRDHAAQLATQVARIVAHEGPIHVDLLIERLKEINDVGRAGANIQANIEWAIKLAAHSGKLVRSGETFLKAKGASRTTFRGPGDGVDRALAWVPHEEIALAVLHIVEDQFGCQRDALPRAIGELFGFGRAPTGLTDKVQSIVDDLIDQGRLVVSGPWIYLA